VDKPEYTVRLLRPAEDDLIEIVTYVAADKPAAADALAARFERDFGLLGSAPYLGRVPREEQLAALGYRYLVVGNYLVFYTVEGRSVLLHRIIHGARDYVKLL
jgi:toxin ParE1/3/4